MLESPTIQINNNLSSYACYYSRSRFKNAFGGVMFINVEKCLRDDVLDNAIWHELVHVLLENASENVLFDEEQIAYLIGNNHAWLIHEYLRILEEVTPVVNV